MSEDELRAAKLEAQDALIASLRDAGKSYAEISDAVGIPYARVVVRMFLINRGKKRPCL